MSDRRHSRREKDRLTGDLTGRSEAPLTFTELFAYWHQHNPYPQFRLFGIWQPDHYDWAQRIIAQGPNAWQEHASELSRRADWQQATLHPQALQWIEHFLDVEASQGDAALQQHLRGCREIRGSSPAESALRQYLRDCGNFFAHVRQYGMAGATAMLAYDERHEKQTRRHEHLGDVLRWCIPESDERLRLFQEVMDGAEPAQSALRPIAIRFLPPLIVKDARLLAILRRVLQDTDPVVRFWAACHLSEMDPATPGLAGNLLIALETRVSDGYDDSVDSDARCAREALARIGQSRLT
jgi:hypothetical protein